MLNCLRLSPFIALMISATGCQPSSSPCPNQPIQTTHWQLKSRLTWQDKQHKKKGVLLWTQHGNRSTVTIMDPLGLHQERFTHQKNQPWQHNQRPFFLKEKGLLRLLNQFPATLTGTPPRLPAHWQFSQQGHRCFDAHHFPSTIQLHSPSQSLTFKVLSWQPLPSK